MVSWEGAAALAEKLVAHASLRKSDLLLIDAAVRGRGLELPWAKSSISFSLIYSMSVWTMRSTRRAAWPRQM